MPLYTKCLRCGGWRSVPEEPSEKNQFPTGLMMNMQEAPSNLCTCEEEPKRKRDA